MTPAILERAAAPAAASARDALARRYAEVRAQTVRLCRGLAPEDQVVQSMPDVSPTKWHLAHTSWFFETFVLGSYLRGYEPLNPTYAFLFNSYYVNAGERHCRAQRGYISRPTVAEVGEYRAHVDRHVMRLLESADEAGLAALAPVVELGIQHEQQHQELMLTDIKHVFSVNPLRPVYHEAEVVRRVAAPLRWIRQEGGLHTVGFAGDGFAYDNESPRHRVWLEPFELASRPATNGEYLAFMADGGYARPDLWLSMGWATVQENQWSEPFYWEKRDGRWWNFTLSGMREVDPEEPVCHLSYFEADAFARWSGARLPTEFEWEAAAAAAPMRGNFVESEAFHPRAAGDDGEGLLQLYGDVWEWTRSQYSPYPGYQAAPGALGEYNGKFMCNQFVLRGGSCATPLSHIRATYRNFFAPESCWQFTGVRLARDV